LGTHTQLEEYPFDSQCVVVIDCGHTCAAGCRCWVTPREAVPTRDAVPQDCIAVILDQQARDPLLNKLCKADYVNLSDCEKKKLGGTQAGKPPPASPRDTSGAASCRSGPPPKAASVPPLQAPEKPAVVPYPAPWTPSLRTPADVKMQMKGEDYVRASGPRPSRR
jgi:hypothetical protein